MPENKPFTPEEDGIIIYLYDELKIKQWSLIAKKLTEEYNIERNAKQCRDRYKQVLDPNSTLQWSQAQQKQLYRLHNTVGNKWALIASHFPGKTDNYVKNYFYSKIRKALRHLNRVIKIYFKKQLKEIKISTIYKIIEGFEEQFKQKPIIGQDVSNQCCQLKDALIMIADDFDQMEQKNQALSVWRQKVLIQKILDFNKNYKKKSKKEKRQSLQVQELFKPSKKIQLIMPIQQNQGYDSQFEEVNASSDQDQQQDLKQYKIVKQDMQSQQMDEIRKSPPIYVIVKDDEGLRESSNSIKSGIQIRLCELMSSCKIQQDDKKNKSLGLRQSNNLDQPDHPFGFMRGQSCFRSCRSKSISQSITQKSKTDMFEQVRISANLKDICVQIDLQRQQNIFRSQK